MATFRRPDEEYLAALEQAVTAHGQVLAVLEQLRLDAEDAGDASQAWALALLARLACALPMGSVADMAVHNRLVDAINAGPAYREPEPAAVFAHQMYAADVAVE